MKRAIVTKGHLESPRTLILDEDINEVEKQFEIILTPVTSKPAKRTLGLLKGKIHISEDFDEPLDEFNDYM